MFCLQELFVIMAMNIVVQLRLEHQPLVNNVFNYDLIKINVISSGCNLKILLSKPHFTMIKTCEIETSNSYLILNFDELTPTYKLIYNNEDHKVSE